MSASDDGNEDDVEDDDGDVEEKEEDTLLPFEKQASMFDSLKVHFQRAATCS